MNNSPQFDLRISECAEVAPPAEILNFPEIDAGLSANAKYISSKFLYDDEGSRIFEKIIQMPEYYPTAAEFEILSFQSDAIIERLNFQQPFKIIEFGAGDGMKTKLLLKRLVEKSMPVTYIPIDISEEATRSLTRSLSGALPTLDIRPLVSDYFSLSDTFLSDPEPCLFLFLGSNLGNYDPVESANLLTGFSQKMKTGDKLLLGLDLMKNPKVIRNAYDDPYGITKTFNLNLLTRFNREFGADFHLDQFDFYCHYDPISGAVKSYLTSLCDQKVTFHMTGKSYQFTRNEMIFTELSQKYQLTNIQRMALRSGFSVLQNFFDCKHYFVDTLWEK